MLMSVKEMTGQLAEVSQGWVERALKTKPRKGLKGSIYWWDKKTKPEVLRRWLKGVVTWQVDRILGQDTGIIECSGLDGPIWVVMGEAGVPTGDPTEGGDYVKARDRIGSVVKLAIDRKVHHLEIVGSGCSANSWIGALVGMDLATYSFKRVTGSEPWPLTSLSLSRVQGKIDPLWLEEAQRIAGACNLARHLVNWPPNVLNPESMSECLRLYFASSPGLKFEIWDAKALKREKMNLLLAVGQASEHPPVLVKAHYRPKGVVNGKAPLALVGKGITFDSGGLDIKPSAGMRWMKKDMGGAAALAGLLHYVTRSQLQQNLDFYLPISSNLISSSAFCPGDIYQSRNGLTVEIHNTDAEGRLALADAIDVAVKQKTPPAQLIDVATLTGAIKAGLGASIAGLFSNRDSLSRKVAEAMNEVGDWVWPMPLAGKYRSSLRSDVADMVNSSDGFGGAITAALFLEKFVGDLPWSHLDIYAWKDSADGAISEAGGSGQAVQGLIRYLVSIRGVKIPSRKRKAKRK